MVWLFVPLALIGVLMFQNCGQSFGVMNQAQLQSISCGDTVPCDADGFPLGKIVIEQLSPSDYPSGSFAPVKTYGSIFKTAAGKNISLVKITGLPPNLTCAQTWLRGSIVTNGQVAATELLAGLENMPCRVGEGMPQSEVFLDSLINSGCFFIESSYSMNFMLPGGNINLNSGGTAVSDDNLARPRVPAARIRFRCELPK